jgi:hypothetical protein
MALPVQALWDVGIRSNGPGEVGGISGMWRLLWRASCCARLSRWKRCRLTAIDCADVALMSLDLDPTLAVFRVPIRTGT